uniref:Neprosin PEP catalytic domain-containing protein n=1 Tax=Kalanchoe fedtschenkoi TaxID=63787 RepID=A0A7N0TAS6_KALFE
MYIRITSEKRRKKICKDGCKSEEEFCCLINYSSLDLEVVYLDILHVELLLVLFLDAKNLPQLCALYLEGLSSLISSSSGSTMAYSAKALKLRGTGKACPDGTVPIKRTTKEDLIRFDRLSKKEYSGGSKAQGVPDKKVNVRLENKGKIYGSSASLALYNLNIADGQESSVDVTVESGPPGQVDELTFGWKGFTDNNGCYNTLCPGFVQVDQEIHINYAFDNVSVYGDEDQQYSTPLSLEQAQDSGNWWLTGGVDRIRIGYWPKELLPNFADGANAVTWGGTATPGPSGNYPPMGNGHLPDEFYKDTCYFHRVTYFNFYHRITEPVQADTIPYMGAPSSCYDLNFVTPNEKLAIEGFSFMFGGPGGRCN